MGIILTLTAFLAMHIGFGLAHLSVEYMGSGTANYGGEAGFLAHTPVRSYFEESPMRVNDPLAFRALFNHITDLADTVWGLLAFDYEVLTDVQPSDGAMYWVAQVFRLINWVSAMALVVMIARFIFSSGIMQSTAGLALVVGGVGITGLLAGLGMVF